MTAKANKLIRDLEKLTNLTFEVVANDKYARAELGNGDYVLVDTKQEYAHYLTTNKDYEFYQTICLYKTTKSFIKYLYQGGLI